MVNVEAFKWVAATSVAAASANLVVLRHLDREVEASRREGRLLARIISGEGAFTYFLASVVGVLVIVWLGSALTHIGATLLR